MTAQHILRCYLQKCVDCIHRRFWYLNTAQSWLLLTAISKHETSSCSLGPSLSIGASHRKHFVQSKWFLRCCRTPEWRKARFVARYRKKNGTSRHLRNFCWHCQVTWDNQSLYIHGERIMIFSGEIHPFRYISNESISYNKSSNWVLASLSNRFISTCSRKLKPSASIRFRFTSTGLFWKATEAPIAQMVFLICSRFLTQHLKRESIFLPAPVLISTLKSPVVASQAGFQEFLGLCEVQTLNIWKITNCMDSWFETFRYLAAWLKFFRYRYLTSVARTIAKNQITNGGPIILYQPENEYTPWENASTVDPQYMQNIMDTAREAGVVIPFINNDQWPAGDAVPGSGVGAVDIYGFDAYP